MILSRDPRATPSISGTHAQTPILAFNWPPRNSCALILHATHARNSSAALAMLHSSGFRRTAVDPLRHRLLALCKAPSWLRLDSRSLTKTAIPNPSPAAPGIAPEHNAGEFCALPQLLSAVEPRTALTLGPASQHRQDSIRGDQMPGDACLRPLPERRP